jgi:hypothetical protein
MTNPDVVPSEIVATTGPRERSRPHCRRWRGGFAQLTAHDAPWFEHSRDLVQVVENYFSAGNMVKYGVRVDEVERVLGEHAQVRFRGEVNVGMRNVVQHLAGSLKHFIGDIDSVNFAEVTAHGPHKASGAAADLEGAARCVVRGRQINQFTFEQSRGMGSAGQEFLRALAPPLERHVVERVFGGAAVPIRAHLLVQIHGYMVCRLG